MRIENAWRNYQNLLSKCDNTIQNTLLVEKIVVKGGMYDVELDKMKCVSIYCPGMYFILLNHCNMEQFKNENL